MVILCIYIYVSLLNHSNQFNGSDSFISLSHYLETVFFCMIRDTSTSKNYKIRSKSGVEHLKFNLTYLKFVHVHLFCCHNSTQEKRKEIFGIHYKIKMKFFLYIYLKWQIKENTIIKLLGQWAFLEHGQEKN